MLPAKLASPPYTAVIECAPADNVEMLNAAVPLISAVDPNAFVPSIKMTVPLGIRPLPVTFAVNVTNWPTCDGLSLDVTLVLLTGKLTFCVKTEEALPVKLPSPLYTAVIGCAPTLRAPAVKAALPPLTGPVPNTFCPSLKPTVPVGMPALPEEIRAVKVTGCPLKDGFSDELAVVVVLAGFTACKVGDDELPAKAEAPL